MTFPYPRIYSGFLFSPQPAFLIFPGYAKFVSFHFRFRFTFFCKSSKGCDLKVKASWKRLVKIVSLQISEVDRLFLLMLFCLARAYHFMPERQTYAFTFLKWICPSVTCPTHRVFLSTLWCLFHLHVLCCCCCCCCWSCVYSLFVVCCLLLLLLLLLLCFQSSHLLLTSGKQNHWKHKNNTKVSQNISSNLA